jgi:Protein of unknown function (DUF2470)
MTDPVADKSGFLCMYMSSHPDTLVAYAKHFGKIDSHILSAKMQSIDSQVRGIPALAAPMELMTTRNLRPSLRRAWI